MVKDQVHHGSLGNGLCRGIDIKRFTRETQMFLHHGGRDTHDAGDILHRLAIGDPFQDLALSPGQGAPGSAAGQGGNLEVHHVGNRQQFMFMAGEDVIDIGMGQILVGNQTEGTLGTGRAFGKADGVLRTIQIPTV